MTRAQAAVNIYVVNECGGGENWLWFEDNSAEPPSLGSEPPWQYSHASHTSFVTHNLNLKVTSVLASWTALRHSEPSSGLFIQARCKRRTSNG